MGKMELEVKVLNIDEKKIIDTILANGGELKEESKQILYTYDLHSLYGRFLDILLLINEYNKTNKENKLKTQTDRLKLLFYEIDNLLTKEDSKKLKEITKKEKLLDLLSLDFDKMLKIINNEEFKDFLSVFKNNDKKWIRVRKTNKKVTIAVKHILADNDTNIQQMLETEIEVPSLESAKDLLQALGYSYNSYQEKMRKSYILKGHEIDIDRWPMLNTYMEIEGTDEEDIEKILSIFGYTMKDTVSCTADDIYKENGIDSLSMRELKF